MNLLSNDFNVLELVNHFPICRFLNVDISIGLVASHCEASCIDLISSFFLSLGLGAVWNTAKVEAGSNVAIFGLGTVGLAVGFYYNMINISSS